MRARTSESMWKASATRALDRDLSPTMSSTWRVFNSHISDLDLRFGILICKL